MVTTDQLAFCKKCMHQKADVTSNVICHLIDKAPDFKESCNYFKPDPDAPAESVFDELDNDISCASASRGKRFANSLIDLLTFYVLTFIVGLLSAILFEILDSSIINENTGGNTLLNYFIGSIVWMTYYTLIEYATGGRSIGKYITKTKVITLEGEKPTFKNCLIRSLCRFIPFEAFSFLGSEDAGLHDSISDTRVVDIS